MYSWASQELNVLEQYQCSSPKSLVSWIAETRCATRRIFDRESQSRRVSGGATTLLPRFGSTEATTGLSVIKGDAKPQPVRVKRLSLAIVVFGMAVCLELPGSNTLVVDMGNNIEAFPGS